jgi:hypothetical protein
LDGYIDDASHLHDALDSMGKYEGFLYVDHYKQIEEQLRWLVRSPFNRTQELLDVNTAATYALAQRDVRSICASA